MTTAYQYEAQIATGGYDALSDRQLLLCLAGKYGSNAGLNAQQAVDLAATNKYASLSDQELMEALLAVLS